ncbi:MAG: hypothetical protein P1U74_11445 [Legionellaceae bacterium]|nr:hypothetical protein [Legionellaceae bacterium]
MFSLFAKNALKKAALDTAVTVGSVLVVNTFLTGGDNLRSRPGKSNSKKDSKIQPEKDNSPSTPKETPRM